MTQKQIVKRHFVKMSKIGKKKVGSFWLDGKAVKEVTEYADKHNMFKGDVMAMFIALGLKHLSERTN